MTVWLKLPFCKFWHLTDCLVELGTFKKTPSWIIRINTDKSEKLFIIHKNVEITVIKALSKITEQFVISVSIIVPGYYIKTSKNKIHVFFE